MNFIECRDLHFSYGEETGEVLHGINLDIRKGEFVALLGHNGCGKSTMAKLFNGMLVPNAGTVRVDGIDTAVEDNQLDVRRRVGLVQQNPDNQLVAGIVEEDVAFGPENLGIEPAEIRRRVDAARKAVNRYAVAYTHLYENGGGHGLARRFHLPCEKRHLRRDVGFRHAGKGSGLRRCTGSYPLRHEADSKREPRCV